MHTWPEDGKKICLRYFLIYLFLVLPLQSSEFFLLFPHSSSSSVGERKEFTKEGRSDGEGGSNLLAIDCMEWSVRKCCTQSYLKSLYAAKNVLIATSKSRIINKNVQTDSNDCSPPSVGAFADLQKEKKNFTCCLVQLLHMNVPLWVCIIKKWFAMQLIKPVKWSGILLEGNV